MGFERVKLPQGERLGLVGTSVLFEVTDSLGVGPAVYGAATGERGRALLDALGLLGGRRGVDWERQPSGVTIRCLWHSENSPSCSVTRVRDGVRVLEGLCVCVRVWCDRVRVCEKVSE